MMTPLDLVRPSADRVASTRECGPCTACCVLPRISPTEDRAFPEGKPGYVPCSHLCERGCSIYGKRPSLCRDYTCLWRSGIVRGDNSRRPDRLGIMFTLDTPSGERGDTRIVVEAWEMWEGAASDHTARFVIDGITERFPVNIRPYGVPVSHGYLGREHLLLANHLSEMARVDPEGLAKWLDARMADGSLTLPEDSAAYLDLDLLRQGNPIPRHYSKPL